MLGNAMMNDPDGFARRLDEALKARGIVKMYALAVELGIDESAISRWRHGRPMSIASLVRLSRHLRISTDWLLMGIGSMDARIEPAFSSWQAEVIADLSRLEPVASRTLAAVLQRIADADIGSPSTEQTTTPERYATLNRAR